MEIELTNMIMIRDKATNRVVVQNRVKSWKGYSLPGGHVLPGESFVDSAIREAKEETGLNVRSLNGCGVIHWSNTQSYDRYLAFLFETTDFDGELLPETEEGANCWMTIDELLAAPSDNGMPDILKMFLHSEYSEAFGKWSDSEPWQITEYK